jgi:hypothetical protein
MRKIVYFSDPLDHGEDMNQFAAIIKMCADDKTREVNMPLVIDTVNPSELNMLLTSADVCFVDYGGMSIAMGDGFSMECERWVRDAIKNHRNCKFVFILTMGRQFYSDDLFDEPNVETIERLTSYKTYDKYLFGDLWTDEDLRNWKDPEEGYL